MSTDVDLKSLVSTSDEQSERLLDLLVTKQSLHDSANYLESLFSSDKVPFDQFIKLMRRVEEDRFTYNYLLKR
jgi:hypothetical protein